MVHSVLVMPWVIPTIFGCLVAMVAVVADVMASTAKANAETNLKRRMVEQGYSAADIERVVCATARDAAGDAEDCAAPAKFSKPPKHYQAML